MKRNIETLVIVLALGVIFSAQAYTQNATPTIPTTTQQVAITNYVNSLDVVASPTKYLNKTVTIKGRFDKFSTLGLDYAPAMRSSEEYISFLIQRDDIKDHNIPLSEMKIFIKRTEAEKYIDINAGDEIEFSGKVFSNALGDAWIDAEKFKVINKKSKEETKK